MRNILISAALALGAIAAPASAQYGTYDRSYDNSNRGYDTYDRGYDNYDRGGGSVSQQIDRLGERLQRNIQNRRITQRDGYQLQRELAQLDRLYDQYGRNGFTRRETQDLQYRVQNLRQRIQYVRNDGRSYDDRRYDDGRNYDRGY